MQNVSTDANTLKLPVTPRPTSGPAELENEQGMNSPAKPGGWLETFRQIWPIYLATHIAFLILTYLASLFKLGNFSSNGLPLNTLLDSWNRWDSGQYTYIALHGYDAPWHTAFFPLFPLLERALMVVVQDPFVAGLIISNVATLGMFMALYRLVAEDFDAARAWRSVLYLAVFPTAFFFAAAYNQPLCLFFVILSFYYIRRGRWWLAGLAALFASLTRSTAVALFVPFVYEYLRQHDFQWRNIRFDVLSAVGLVGGILIFGTYGYLTFHDFLAFSHAEKVWGRQLSFPWYVFLKGVGIIRHNALLTFPSIHAVMELSSILFILLILILAFVGPWKLAREHWSYAFYACTIYLLLIMLPETGGFPLSSLSRYMLEVFPAFVMLAAIGQRRNFNIYYLAICLPLLAFMLLQWLTGGWIV